MPTPIPGYPLLEWCNKPASATRLEVRLNTVPLLANTPLAMQTFIEPTFPGYMPAGNETWALRELIDVRGGYAQSGTLSWVASDNSYSANVTGYFIRAIIGGEPVVIVAEDFDAPVHMSTRGDHLAMVIFLDDLIFQLTH